MGQNKNSLDLDYEGGKIRVQQHSVNGQLIYKVIFSDKRPAMILTRATGTEIGEHWTSVPEGRFNEAQEIGLLIEEYFN